MSRLRYLALAPLVVAGLATSATATSYAATQSPPACVMPSDLYLASLPQLTACGLSEIPLTGESAMPGGGTSYNYTMPDGEVYHTYQMPTGFDPETASASEDAAYGIPPKPPTSSPGYSTWLKMAEGEWASAGATPYLVASTAPLTQPQTAGTLSPAYTSVSNPHWAGYTQAGSGWTLNEAVWHEPSMPATSSSCPDNAVSIWAGIGNKSTALGQDGTWSGYGTPGAHYIFYENLPAGGVLPGPTAPAGSYVNASTAYNGGGLYYYDIEVGNTDHSYTVSNASYDGSVVEDIVERPYYQKLGGYSPLKNFDAITIAGYDGQSLSQMRPTKQWNMTGYASTGAYDSSTNQFVVHHLNCSG